jgi:Fe-S cluster assembly ATP-binding protein
VSGANHEPSELRIEGLHAAVAGQEILRGIDLRIRSGEVHAVMGPNGSGKSTLSHVLLGRPGYQVTAGRVLLNGVDLLVLPTWRRAQAGLFLGLQYPIEVPGVSLVDVLSESWRAGGRDPGEVPALLEAEAARVGFDARFLSRPLNVDLSGGERKRNETVQLGVLRPRFAVLDEIDSGLDVDALRAVARRVEAATTEIGLGVLAITHYTRLLSELRPDHTHVLSKGRIVASGGPELADELEHTGYAGWAEQEEVPAVVGAGRLAGPSGSGPSGSGPSGSGPSRSAQPERPQIDDPFGGPGRPGDAADPFADPLT